MPLTYYYYNYNFQSHQMPLYICKCIVLAWNKGIFAYGLFDKIKTPVVHYFLLSLSITFANYEFGKLAQSTKFQVGFWIYGLPIFLGLVLHQASKIEHYYLQPKFRTGESDQNYKIVVADFSKIWLNCAMEYFVRQWWHFCPFRAFSSKGYETFYEWHWLT